jgi:hypothetical protein
MAKSPEPISELCAVIPASNPHPSETTSVSNKDKAVLQDDIITTFDAPVVSEGLHKTDTDDGPISSTTLVPSPTEIVTGESHSYVSPEVIVIEEDKEIEGVVDHVTMNEVKCSSGSQKEKEEEKREGSAHASSIIRRKSRRMFRALERAMRDPFSFIGAFSAKSLQQQQQQLSTLTPQQEANISLPSLAQLGHSISSADELHSSLNAGVSIDLLTETDPSSEEVENENERNLAELLAYNLALLPDPRNLGYLGRFSGAFRDVYGSDKNASNLMVDVKFATSSASANAINEPVEVSMSGQSMVPIIVTTIEGEEKE